VLRNGTARRSQHAHAFDTRAACMNVYVSSDSAQGCGAHLSRANGLCFVYVRHKTQTVNARDRFIPRAAVFGCSMHNERASCPYLRQTLTSSHDLDIDLASAARVDGDARGASQLCNFITVAERMGGLDALLASITSVIGHSQGITAAVVVGAAEGSRTFGALSR
jgi:hypothetical protein